MAARVVGIRQEGVNPCWMVPSMRDEVHVQLHDVTGNVRELRVAALVLRKIKKKIGERKQASLSGEQDSQGRGERPPVWGQDDL